MHIKEGRDSPQMALGKQLPCASNSLKLTLSRNYSVA
jgi:hypothetical protein